MVYEQGDVVGKLIRVVAYLEPCFIYMCYLIWCNLFLFIIWYVAICLDESIKK